MRSGNLRHVVTIERAVDVVDDQGNVSTQWIPFLERIAAHVVEGTEQRGNESGSGPMVEATTSTAVRIRYREGILPTMRVRWERGPGSPTVVELFDIQAVTIADKYRRELRLAVIRRDTQGYRSGEA